MSHLRVRANGRRLRPRRPGRHPWAQRLTPLALVVAICMLSAPAAAAQETPGPTDEPTVRASLDTIQPAAPQPGDTLVLAGTVENTGDEPLGKVQAVFRFNSDPLDDRADVRRVATDRNVRWGQRDPQFFDDELGDDELSPGETADFRLEIPVDEIDLGRPGVYALGVDIRATPIEDGRLADAERFTANTTRTVIPWLPGPEPLPAVQVALFWPLAAQPSLLPDGTLLGDDLAAQLAPGGILNALLAAPSASPVTWVVDPDLLATARVMADGYRVSSADGATADGVGARDAATWLEAYAAATAGQQPLLLPYANPDVEAFGKSDPEGAADAAHEAFVATETLADAGATAGQTDVAVPAGGAASEETMAALASAGAHTVVLSGEAVAPETNEPRATIRAGEGEIDAVLTDAGLDTAIDDALRIGDAAAGATALRQSWLAETSMLALDAVESGDPPAQVVAAAPYGWQPDPAIAHALAGVWTETPWLTAIPLAAVATPEEPIVVTSSPLTVNPAPLPQDYVDSVTALRDQGAHYAALLAEPDGIVDRLDEAALRAASSTWRADPQAGATYTALATTTATSRLRQVSVQVPESVTLSSSRGTFPLTVSNDLDEPVMVKLELTPDNPDRMSVAEVTPQRVEAGEKATVEVTAEAAVNGRVPMTVQLTAVDGSPLGASQRTIVNATEYGAIGWVVVGGGVALFLAAAALRLLRQRQQAAPRPGLDAEAGVDPVVDVAVEPEPQRETAR